MKDLGFGNLGFINVAIIYITFSLFALFAIRINKFFGTRVTIFMSALTYTFWTACFLLPAYRFETKDDQGILSDTAITLVIIISAAFLGMGAGPLWVSQGAYIGLCASHKNKGRYNSLFWGVFQTASLIAYPIAGWLIDNYDKIVFFWSMTLISLLGSLLMLCLRPPKKIEEDGEEG